MLPDMLVVPLLWLGCGLAMYAISYFGTRYQISRRDAKPPMPEAVKTEIMTVAAWVDWNHWFLLHENYRAEAEALHVARRLQNPNESLDDNLAAVTGIMRLRHPEIRPN